MNRRNRRDFLKNGIAATLGTGMCAQMIPRLSAQSPEDPAQVKPESSLPPQGNPIIPGRGVCDPHIRVFDGTFYMYATHDYSPENRFFRMDNWWVWHSDDLVHWNLASILKPEETFVRKALDECWATDAGMRDGKYYFYFSAGPKQIGVVTGDTPAGPWKDPLGKPLIPEGLTPTQERDPGILMDDDGSNYIVFGTMDYYIAKLNDDMISLAESPRLIHFDREYGPYGEGKVDDKPYLHKRDGVYYLSWGCFYAMGSSPYGPFYYKGSIIDQQNTAPDFRTENLVHDRHGSFFQFHGQWYFVCNDQSQKGSQRFFRNSILSYVHYCDNGEIAPVKISSVGVGRYDASLGRIEAEDFFKIAGGQVRECPMGGFEVRGLANGSLLFYPNVQNIPSRAKLICRLSSEANGTGNIEIHESNAEGKLLGSAAIPNSKAWDKYVDVAIPIAADRPMLSLAFIFRGEGSEVARLDFWKIVAEDAEPAKA